MKKLLSVVAFLGVATVLAAAAPPVHDVVLAQQSRADGIYMGSRTKPVQILGAMNVAGSADGGGISAGGYGPITRVIPFTTAAIDFASGTIVCVDSAGTTVTGARLNDPCFVSVPSTFTAGGTGLHHSFTCYVSAADTIKVRACAAGTADDPGSATFSGFVLSSAP